MITSVKLAIVRTALGLKSNIYNLLLLAFPFTEQILTAIAANLPYLAPYLPADVYKWTGFTVVAVKVVYDMIRRTQKAKAA